MIELLIYLKLGSIYTLMKILKVKIIIVTSNFKRKKGAGVKFITQRKVLLTK